jgi:hypothetical protein
VPPSRLTEAVDANYVARAEAAPNRGVALFRKVFEMPGTTKKLRSLIVAGVVIGATQLALVAPAHAEEVCVPIDTQTDLGPGLRLCVGAGEENNPGDTGVWAYLESSGQPVAGTGVALGETGSGLPTVYGGVVAEGLIWVNYQFQVTGGHIPQSQYLCITTWAPLPAIETCPLPALERP